MPKKKDTGAKGQVNLTDLKQQIQALTDALQRERADATNLRRQHDEQLARLRASIKAQVITDLLPVVDNFERALKHIPKDLEGNEYIKGVGGIVRQFEQALNDLGVARIETVGREFDPRYHEAVSMEEGDGTTEMITEELQAGYKLGDDVIRHAMVKVQQQ